MWTFVIMVCFYAYLENSVLKPIEETWNRYILGYDGINWKKNKECDPPRDEKNFPLVTLP